MKLFRFVLILISCQLSLLAVIDPVRQVEQEFQLLVCEGTKSLEISKELPGCVLILKDQWRKTANLIIDELVDQCFKPNRKPFPFIFKKTLLGELTKPDQEMFKQFQKCLVDVEDLLGSVEQS